MLTQVKIKQFYTLNLILGPDFNTVSGILIIGLTHAKYVNFVHALYSNTSIT